MDRERISLSNRHLNCKHEYQGDDLVDLWNCSAKSNLDERSKLHGLHEEDGEVEGQRQWRQKVPRGANGFIRWQEPWYDAAK